jgi:hypothetical protein
MSLRTRVGVDALEDKIEQIAVDALRKATEYEGFDLIPEQVLAFQADPVWSHFGMGNEAFLKLRYIGNYYTAIFRKLGDMYEGFVKAILAHTLHLTDEQLALSYVVEIDGKPQTRTLDVGLDTAELKPRSAANVASVVHDLESSYQGGKLGFEVRCCYQIGDSKRIQADATAAGFLRDHGYLPILMIFCTTSLPSPVKRLRKSWVVTEGMASYDLLRRLSGFDLYKHMTKLRPRLAQEMRNVLKVFQLPTM